MTSSSSSDCEFCGTAIESGERWCPAHYCIDCTNATGGVCCKHAQPECTCYESQYGHQPGCAFSTQHRQDETR